MTAPAEIARALGMPEGATVEECCERIAESQRISRALDFMCNLFNDYCKGGGDTAKKLSLDVAAFEARERKLREALEPFAQCVCVDASGTVVDVTRCRAITSEQWAKVFFAYYRSALKPDVEKTKEKD